MKRCIAKLCVFLFIGAMVNVAVADLVVILRRETVFIVVMVYNDNYPGYYRNFNAPDSPGPAITFIQPDGDEMHFRRVGQNIDYVQRFRKAAQTSPDPNSGVDTALVSGWPQKSARSFWLSEAQMGQSVNSTLKDELRAALPIVPVWPGFAINTVFYAAILWLLFAAPGWARRRIRVARRQCPACAYPIGSSDVCTECGGPVSGTAQRRGRVARALTRPNA